MSLHTYSFYTLMKGIVAHFITACDGAAPSLSKINPAHNVCTNVAFAVCLM